MRISRLAFKLPGGVGERDVCVHRRIEAEEEGERGRLDGGEKKCIIYIEMRMDSTIP